MSGRAEMRRIRRRQPEVRGSYRTVDFPNFTRLAAGLSDRCAEICTVDANDAEECHTAICDHGDSDGHHDVRPAPANETVWAERGCDDHARIAEGAENGLSPDATPRLPHSGCG